MRRALTLLLTLSLLFLSIPSSALLADDEDVCADAEDEQACRIGQAKESSKKIAELNEQIAAAKKDLASAQSLANQYYLEAEALQTDIDDLNVKIDELIVSIDELTVKIEDLKTRIEENETKVEELNTRVLERMEESQGTMHFNPFIDFILGSNGFADMLRRTYGVEAIMSKDSSDRNELIDIISQLNADREELETSKTELENAKAELDASKEELVNKQAEYLVKMEYYEEIEEETEALIESIQNQLESEKRSYKEILSYIDDISSLPSTEGFLSPIPGARISAGVWFYPSGGLHLGVDYAVKYGSAIYAPSNGVILVSYNGCGYGYLGCTCGGDGNGNGVSYGGNQVYMMTSVNNKVYAITFSHLKEAVAERYSVVMAGDLIGYVGSSGNSTGPHSHIELYYLGEGDMEDLQNIYLQKDYSLSFNCGWGWSAYYNTRCSVTGGEGPCRLNPEDYFGS